MKNTRIQADHSYYGHLRMQLIALVEGHPKKILEVGCGHGQTLSYLKRQRSAEFVAGIELVPEVASIARRNADIDAVLTGDFEQTQLNFPPGYFDLIIASHVLEHFKDPWRITRHLRDLLAPGGQFIGSLPNVRHIKVSLPLLVSGKFQYEDEGILDWTHTKFFTKSTIEELIRSSGFVVQKIEPEFMPKAELLNKVTVGFFKNLLCFTYNFSARVSLPAIEGEGKIWDQVRGSQIHNSSAIEKS